MLNSTCLATAVTESIWRLQNQVSGGQSAHMSDNFHVIVPIPMYLQFLTDVLNVLHVFDDGQHGILGTQVPFSGNFCISFSSVRPRG